MCIIIFLIPHLFLLQDKPGSFAEMLNENTFSYLQKKTRLFKKRSTSFLSVILFPFKHECITNQDLFCCCVGFDSPERSISSLFTFCKK